MLSYELVRELQWRVKKNRMQSQACRTCRCRLRAMQLSATRAFSALCSRPDSAPVTPCDSFSTGRAMRPRARSRWPPPGLLRPAAPAPSTRWMQNPEWYLTCSRSSYCSQLQSRTCPSHTEKNQDCTRTLYFMEQQKIIKIEERRIISIMRIRVYYDYEYGSVCLHPFWSCLKISIGTK